MAEEKNDKKTRETPQKEEKELLAREEIKTMKKDVARLREGQAQLEREKIIKLKTEEEAKKEKEREERAKKATLERGLAEKQIKQREEELKRLKAEREKKEELLEKKGVEQAEMRTEEFKQALKERQNLEEQERKRFLERVKAQTKTKEEKPMRPAPPEQAPTPAPPPPSKPGKIPAFLKKPSLLQKLWIRIILSLLLLAILATVFTFWYWYLMVRDESIAQPPAPIVAEEKKEPIIPPPLFFVERTRALDATNFVESLSQLLKTDLEKSQFTRVLIKDTEENEILGLREFFSFFLISVPQNFYNKAGNDFTLFIYSQADGNRLGFVAKIEENAFQFLKSWEATMEEDFDNLFIFLGKENSSLTPYFRDAEHKNVDFRYLSFSPENFGICWAQVDDYFIFTSSGESIMKTIDRIK